MLWNSSANTKGCREGTPPGCAEGTCPPSPISSNLCILVHSPGREHEPSGAALLGIWLCPQGAVGLLANLDARKDPAEKKETSNRNVEEKTWSSSADGLCSADPQATHLLQPRSQPVSRPVSVQKVELAPGHHLGELHPAAAPWQAQLPEVLLFFNASGSQQHHK